MRKVEAGQKERLAGEHERENLGIATEENGPHNSTRFNGGDGDEELGALDMPIADSPAKSAGLGVLGV